jgi:cysteine desulfurase/selenocysteine lyase
MLALTADDEVVFPASEHHSNYLPWRLGARAVLVDIDDEAVPRWQQLEHRIGKRTKLVAVAHASNVTGAVAPVEEWIATAHAAGVPVLIDASQSIAHLPIDVRALDVDFLGFSSHKMFGPNGVGVLYVRRDRFASLALGNVGGGMVAMLADDRFEPLEAPFRYEAGTPNVEGVIGLGAAVDYLLRIGMPHIAAHSRALAAQLIEGLNGLPQATVLGRSVRDRIALATVSLPWPSMRQQDIARLLADSHAIFVSSGFHCAHVLHHRLKLDGTLRASAHIYNDAGDIDAFIRALHDV